MTEEAELDQNVVIRGILESMVSGEINPRGVSADNVAQLLAAAIAAGQNIINVQGSPHTEQEGTGSNQAQENGTFEVNSLTTEKTDYQDQESDSDPSEALKPRQLCVKLPIEVRKKIITLRKEGKKCREIAKDLKVSVSGVRKVWERFLATGMVHDLKPNSGRPRKYPVPASFEIQYTPESVVSSDSPHIEYVTISESTTEDTVSTVSAPLTSENVFVEGPLDMPGATVEIVETDPQPFSTPQGKGRPRKGPPVYREQLLLRLIEGCPLAALREDGTKTSSPHVQNLDSITKRALYMESILGYPFGQIPPPKPFSGDLEEAKTILSDPVKPLGKDMLAALGYSTKVYFNMCCKVSPLFDQHKVLSTLPFSIGPGHIADTTQSVLQLLLNLCKDPVSAMTLVPLGDGPEVTVKSSEGQTLSAQVNVPKKLSSYWGTLYQCVSAFRCCENFISATIPSAPCLLCHPFQDLAKQLEIREPSEEEIWSPRASIHSLHSTRLSLSNSTVQETPEIVQEPSRTGRKRGRPKKSTTTTSEDQLMVDGQFEMPETMESSSPSVIRIVLEPTQTSERTEETVAEDSQTDTCNLEQTDAASSSTEVTQESSIETSNTQCDQSTSSATPNIADSESNLQANNTNEQSTRRRSPRKRAHKTISDVPKTRTKGVKDSQPSDREASAEKDARIGCVVAEDNSHPANWGMEEVVEFVASIPRCKYSTTFREHEVDGESLLSLDPEMMVKLMGIKTGPALKIHRKIEELKHKYVVAKPISS